MGSTHQPETKPSIPDSCASVWWLTPRWCHTSSVAMAVVMATHAKVLVVEMNKDLAMKLKGLILITGCNCVASGMESSSRGSAGFSGWLCSPLLSSAKHRCRVVTKKNNVRSKSMLLHTHEQELHVHPVEKLETPANISLKYYTLYLFNFLTFWLIISRHEFYTRLYRWWS